MPDSYTKLLMHCNVSPFVDVIGKTVTNNNVTLDTDIKKFGAGSAYFNGTSAYFSVPNSADFEFATGNFTVDMWVRFSGFHESDDNQVLYDYKYDEGILIRKESSNQLCVYSGSGTNVIAATWNPVVDTWYHIAITRADDTLRAFIDGIKLAEVEFTRSITTTQNLYLGGGGLGNLIGYLEEVRVSKGIARWTADFTPSTSEYNGESIVKRPLPSFFRI